MQIRTHIILIAIVLVLITNEMLSQHNYRDYSTSQEDIDFYNLQTLSSTASDGTKLQICVPKLFEGLQLIKNQDLSDNTVFYYEYFDENRILEISIETLQTRNTIKFDNDKDYIGLLQTGFKKYYNGDLEQIKRILPPTMKNCRVLDFRYDILIHGKHYGKRTCYYNDLRLEGTPYEKSTCTEVHYFTLHNKTKYELFLKYTGNDKGIADLTSLFSTIAGTLKFENIRNKASDNNTETDKSATTYSKSLKALIDSNKKLSGQRLDEKIVFDSSYIKNKTFVYAFTVNGHQTESATKIDFRDKIFERLMQLQLQNDVNLNNVDFKIIHDARINLEFEYYSDDFREKIAIASFVRTADGFRLERAESEWNKVVDLMFEKMQEKLRED